MHFTVLGPNSFLSYPSSLHYLMYKIDICLSPSLTWSFPIFLRAEIQKMLTFTQNTDLPGEIRKLHFNSKLFLMDPSFLSKVKDRGLQCKWSVWSCRKNEAETVLRCWYPLRSIFQWLLFKRRKEYGRLQEKRWFSKTDKQFKNEGLVSKAKQFCCPSVLEQHPQLERKSSAHCAKLLHEVLWDESGKSFAFSKEPYTNSALVLNSIFLSTLQPCFLPLSYCLLCYWLPSGWKISDFFFFFPQSLCKTQNCYWIALAGERPHNLPLFSVCAHVHTAHALTLSLEMGLRGDWKISKLETWRGHRERGVQELQPTCIIVLCFLWRWNGGEGTIKWAITTCSTLCIHQVTCSQDKPNYILILIL